MAELMLDTYWGERKVKDKIMFLLLDGSSKVGHEYGGKGKQLDKIWGEATQQGRRKPHKHAYLLVEFDRERLKLKVFSGKDE